MTTQHSHLHSQLIINGELVAGYSEDDPPVEFESITHAEEMYGQDGTLYAKGTSRRGVTMTVKLLPSSTTAEKWMRRSAEISQGARLNWEGSYGDQALGTITALRGGFLKEAPVALVPGQTAEFVFVWEESLPQFDGSNLSPSPGQSSFRDDVGDVITEGLADALSDLF